MKLAPSFKRSGVAVILACTLAPTNVHAEGLQVSPASITIEDRSGIVWLDNASQSELRAQVRVFRWHQDNGQDELVETRDVIASPPFVQIDAESQQVVRLVNIDGESGGNLSRAACEDTYRIIVDELPQQSGQREAGLSYVLRYSVPVYLTNTDCVDPQPTLEWRVVTEGQNAWLEVANSGQMRAQLAGLDFVSSSGERTNISGGLFGYVLAGASRQFGLSQPASTFLGGGSLEVKVNGKQIVLPISVASKGP